MRAFRFRIAPQVIAIVFLALNGLILFQNCSSSNMKIDYLEESSISIQGVAEVKFDQQKVAYGPSVTQLSFMVEKASSDKIKGYSCQWEGLSPFDCSSKTVQLGALADGDQKLKIKISFDSGQSEEAFAVIRIDRSQPSISFTQMPNAISNQAAGNIIFLSQDVVSGLKSVTCSLNSSPSSNCTGSFSFSNLANGDHSLKVRAEDQAGNVMERSFNWKVDLIVPTISITQSPASITNSSSAEFRFEGVNQNSFECSLDAAAFTACTSPKNYTGLSAANHTFRVRSLRNNGNMSSVAQKTWMIDTSVPEVRISQGPSNPTNSKTAKFYFMSDDAGQYYCSLDNSSFEVCSSPKEYTNLAAGNHVFRVKIKNAAGTESMLNEDNTFAWVIDLSVPTVTLSSSVAPTTNQTSVQFSFSGAGIVSYKCRLDAGSFQSCTSPRNISDLSAGEHSFQVIGTNAVGTESAAAKVDWTIDLTPPVLTILSKPKDWESVNSVTITFNAPTANRYECALDTGAFNTCGSPAVFSSLSEGSHQVKIRAFSAAGNVSNLETVSFGVDTSIPKIEVSQRPSAFSKLSNERIEFTADGISTSVECQINSGAWGLCNSPLAINTSVDGAYSVNIKATSRSGLFSPIENVSWVTDKVAPTAPVVSLNVGEFTQKKDVEVSFSADDLVGISKYECALNSSSYQSCSSPYLLNNLSDTAYTISVRASDQAGNLSPASAKSFTVDTKTPVLVFGTVTPALVSGKSEYSDISIAFSASDAGSGLVSVVCEFDDGEPFACESQVVDLKDVEPGTHSLKVIAKDRVGLETQSTFNWERVVYNPLTEYQSLTPIDLISVPTALHGSDLGSIYLTSACGVHKVSEGNQGLEVEAKDFSVAGGIRSIAEAMSGADRQVFVGATTGLWQSSDGGDSFEQVLDLAKAKSILAGQSLKLNPCSTQTMPNLTSFSIRKVTARGSTLVLQLESHPGVLFVSSDLGEKWDASVFSIDKGFVSIPQTVTSVRILEDEDILVAAQTNIVSGSSVRYYETSSGNCKGTTVNYSSGAFRSTDGGKKFSALKTKASFLSDIYQMKGNGDILGFAGASIVKSSDNGASFSLTNPSALSKVLLNLIEVHGKQKFSEDSNGLFIQAFDSTKGFQVFKSTDQAATFSILPLDQRFETGQLGIDSQMAFSSQKQVLSTANGLYLTASNGSRLESNYRFKSSYCYYPWWQTGDNGSVFEEGETIVKSEGYKQVFFSQDSGQTFTKNSWGSIPVSKIFKGQEDDLVYFDNGNGKLGVTSLATAALPISWSSSYANSETGLTYYAVEERNGYALYVSTDSKNFSSQLTAYYKPKNLKLLGALSEDKRTVAITDRGIASFDDGVFKSDILAVSPEVSLRSVSFIDGSIFIAGDKSYVSNDKGVTFIGLKNAPYGLSTIWQSGTKLRGSVEGSGRLYESSDNGLSWVPAAIDATLVKTGF